MTDDTYITVIATLEGMNSKFRTAYAHAQSIVQNGGQVELKCGPAEQPISIRQRGFLNGVVLPQIAEQVFVGEKRERFTVDVWREYWRKRLLPDKWVMRKLPGQKRATPHRVRVSTEMLGVRGYSKHIDRIIDIAVVEFNVRFEFQDVEREAVRYVDKKTRRAQ